MKYFILLAFIAVCNASLFGYQSYGVRREIRVHGERRIFINAARKIVIFNVPKEDPTVLEIIVKDQNRNMTVIKLNNDKQIIKHITTTPFGNHLFNGEETGLTKSNEQVSDNSQMKILVKIFKKHEGLTGEAALYEILREVKSYVERRELAPIIYEVLSDLQVKPLFQSEQRTDHLDEEARTAEEISTRRNIELRQSEDQKRYIDTINQDTNERRIDELHSALQVQWIQNLLKSKLKQQSSDLRNKQEKEVRHIALQTNIHELERDIQREQLNIKQLQNQQWFLNDQKEKLRLHLGIAQKHNLTDLQLLELRLAYDQLKSQEEVILQEQLTIHRIIRKLQDELIKKEEQLKDDLKKEYEPELRH